MKGLDGNFIKLPQREIWNVAQMPCWCTPKALSALALAQHGLMKILFDPQILLP